MNKYSQQYDDSLEIFVIITLFIYLLFLWIIQLSGGKEILRYTVQEFLIGFLVLYVIIVIFYEIADFIRYIITCDKEKENN